MKGDDAFFTALKKKCSYKVRITVNILITSLHHSQTLNLLWRGYLVETFKLLKSPLNGMIFLDCYCNSRFVKLDAIFLLHHSANSQGTTINDLGGGENRQRKKFEGLSPGKKSERPSFRKKKSQRPFSREKSLKPSLQGKKI